MDPEHFDYFAAGAGAELSLAETEEAWRSWWLRPRVLRDTAAVSTATTVLGEPVTMPLLTAPTALNGLAHPDGEVAVARACRDAGIVQVVSSGSSRELEEVAGAGGRLWFQLYALPTWEATAERVRRAADAGATVLVITVDLPELGLRPRGLGIHDHRDPADIPLLGGRLGQVNPRLDWRQVERIRALTPMRCVLKGILHPDDARLACEAGVDGVVVSNHGARQLDGEIPSAVALPEIVEAVGGRCEVYVDSGVRGGVDVLRALALGARAALIGRPYLWALAIAGEAGVAELLARYREELRNALALCGQPDAGAVEPSIVTPSRARRR
jgi:4-hydroxymandelate oxidase